MQCRGNVHCGDAAKDGSLTEIRTTSVARVPRARGLTVSGSLRVQYA